MRAYVRVRVRVCVRECVFLFIKIFFKPRRKSNDNPPLTWPRDSLLPPFSAATWVITLKKQKNR